MTTDFNADALAALNGEVLEEHIRFVVESQTLQTAIRELQTHNKYTDNALLVVAAEHGSDLFDEYGLQGNSDAILIGAAGNGQAHVFVQLDGTVHCGGVFLLHDTKPLNTYARATNSSIEIKYLHSDYPILEVRRTNSTKNVLRIETHLPYDESPEGIGMYFDLEQHSVAEIPENTLDNAAIDMITRATKIPSSAPERHGDLVWTNTHLAFTTNFHNAQQLMATSQRVAITSPLEEDQTVRWEIPTDELKALAKSLKGSSARYGITLGEEEGDSAMFLLTYEVSVGGENIYVQRQFQMTSDNQDMKTWIVGGSGSSDEDLFGHDGCRLFATVAAQSFFSAGARLSAGSAPIIRMSTEETEEDGAFIRLETGDMDNPSFDAVTATIGDSVIEQLLLHPDSLETMANITDSAVAVQLLTFPDPTSEEPKERDNGLLIVPLNMSTTGLERKEDEKPTDPDRYMLLYWNA